MAVYAMLIDETRCTGCRACQIACKQWNDLPAEITHNRGSYTNPPALSARTWSLIEFREVEIDGRTGFYFLKRACMHCEHPACASACPVGALYKSFLGPVLYDDRRCIGCRYCMIACPFRIPTFQWDRGILDNPLIRKCNLCIDRVSQGLEPACAKTCPATAIVFGNRDALVAQAEMRIERHPDRYVHHVYGKTEAGGTSILYLSHIPFIELGLPALGTEPIPALSEKVMSVTIPFAFTWAAVLAGAYGIMRLRERGKPKASEPASAVEKEEEASK